MKEGTYRPFHKQSFYLDLKGSPHESTLAKDLRILGAKVEPVFSKDVSFVISNRVSLKSNSFTAQPNSKAINASQWTPPTPMTMCPSPQYSECSTNSPTVSNSPTTSFTNLQPTLTNNGNQIPMSRGLALVQKASLKMEKTYTTDILEVCKRWGVKVYHVDKLLSKVKQLKAFYSAKYAAEKKKVEKKTQVSDAIKKLRPPYLKIEDAKRVYKPIYKEFSSWTNVVDSELSKKICQLKKQFNVCGNVDSFVRPVLREVNGNNYQPKPRIAFDTRINRSRTKSISKLSGMIKPSDSTSLHLFTGKRKCMESASNVSNKKQGMSKRKIKTLYCEICSKNYINLDEHLQSAKHLKFMSNPINFLAVQNIISNLSKGDFVMSSSPFEQVHCGLSEQVGMEMLPINMPGSFELGYQTYRSTITEVNTGMNQVEDDTELYSIWDPGFVSPSCSTPESAGLPFLEDSLDENIYKVMKISTFDENVNKPVDENINGLFKENAYKLFHKSVSEPFNKNTDECSNKNANELSCENVNELSMETVNELSMETVNEFSMETANKLSIETVNELSMETVNEFSMETVNEFSMETVNEFSMETVNKLSMETENRFSNKSANELTNEYANELSNKTTNKPSNENTNKLSNKNANQPFCERIKEPFVENVEEPFVENVEEPFVENVEEPLAKNVEEPLAKNVERPFVEKVERPFVEKVEGPFVENIEGPFVESVEEPFVENVEEPFVENVEEPFVESVKEPFVEIVKEPFVKNPQIETRDENFKEPYNEIGKEPRDENGKEPRDENGKEPHDENEKELFHKNAKEPFDKNAKEPFDTNVKERFDENVNDISNEGIDEPFTDSEIEENFVNEDDWQSLHIEVSNLCETLGSSDEI